MDSDTDTAETVIGLDVRGQMFYCNKTKLLNANNGCSYFSARFREDSMLDAGLDRVDNEGRDIYKLDRDPLIFQYIMEYIRTDKKSIGIGVYELNKQIWRLVRDEALYFGLDSLVQLMMITYSCSPKVDEGLGASGKGIMYWLGTKKATSDYVNPYSSGAVSMSGWDCKGKEQKHIEVDKELMVEYRPAEGEALDDDDINAFDFDDFKEIFSNSFGAMMGCSTCSDDSICLHLLNGVSVSPTHYSIRSGGCYGMSSGWNFEASVDGKNWDVIHESRGRSPLYSGIRDDGRQQLWDTVKEYKGEERRDAICDHMEENHRHTWRVNNAARNFYTHFRFVTVEALHEVEGDDESNDCLHGIGFELYGDICEEWGDESETHIRIEQLEGKVEELQSQNKALLNENESLKARIRQLENKRSADEACLPEN